MTTNREALLGACDRIASRQFGLITATQAKECGLSAHAIRRCCVSGRWRRVYPGVFSVSRATDRWRRDVTAVGLWLCDDGAISHRAAAAWWELDACAKAQPEATATMRKVLPGVLIHQVSDLSSADQGMSHGIWVTSPTRTLIDLAAVVDYDQLEAATHCALRRKLTTVKRIERAFARSAPVRGRPGGAAIRELLNDLRTNGSATESFLETRFWQWVRRSGLPLPVRQHIVRDRDRFVGRVDFAYPAQRFAIECQSFQFHGSAEAFQNDQARLNDLHDCDWHCRLVTKRDLDRPEKLYSEISRRLGIRTLFDC